MNIYTEKSTRLLYEAKLFDTCVLVRPVSPGFESLVQRMEHVEFEREFEEFCGVHEELIQFLGGQVPPELYLENDNDFE